MAAPVTVDTVRTAPKVLLHDHLDGGLRPATIVELAADCGYDALPSTDPDELGQWFFAAADSGSLERYLETFSHTLAVMQTSEGLKRVAAECAQDLAADGVIYAEVRFAPEQHLTGGLTPRQVVDAVLDGFAEGSGLAVGRGIRVRALLTAMRQHSHARDIAELVTAFRGREVAGFDLAGPEAGFPPTAHLSAFDYLREHHEHITIHAGEGDGLTSIDQAVTRCGAERLGHGVRIADDIATDRDGTARLGRLAGYVRDRQIPLEIAPTSNLQTGIATRLADHPVQLLATLGFNVTINTDNRLMSNVSLTSEMTALADTFGYDWDNLERFTVGAMRAAFLPYDERERLVEDVIRPAYAALRE